MRRLEYIFRMRINYFRAFEHEKLELEATRSEIGVTMTPRSQAADSANFPTDIVFDSCGRLCRLATNAIILNAANEHVLNASRSQATVYSYYVRASCLGQATAF